MREQAQATARLAPHEFQGRLDRWCELCNLPDRNPIHNIPSEADPEQGYHEIVAAYLNRRLDVNGYHRALKAHYDSLIRHDDKGYSEEKCVRCGWVMGSPALNCQNDNTPHEFPSQSPVAVIAGIPLEKLAFDLKEALDLLGPDHYDDATIHEGQLNGYRDLELLVELARYGQRYRREGL